MKKIVVLTAFIMFAAFSNVLSGAEGPGEKSYNRSLASLIYGLQNGNKGLKISCALTLGEYKFEKATGALCEILGSENDLEVKFAAMYALYRIRTDDAVKALESASKSYGSPLQTAAEVLYTDIMRNSNTVDEYAR